MAKAKKKSTTSASVWVPYSERALDERHSHEGLMTYVANVIEEQLYALRSVALSAADYSLGSPTFGTPPLGRVHPLRAESFDVGPPTIREQITHHLHVKNTDHKKPGRPTSEDLVRQEARRLLDASGGWQHRWHSLRQFTHKLSDWLAHEHPTMPQMVPKVVERHVRDIWQQHRKEHEITKP
jgi:hypothetical protein